MVGDKEFTDLFQQDRRRIMQHFTTWFQDITMDFKTLQSSRISFRITSLTLIHVKALTIIQILAIYYACIAL